MITLLTSMKPFRGRAAQLQANALANWRRLGAENEIIIYGEGEGLAAQAPCFGALHVADIRSNATGIPDFSAIAEHAATHARFERQVYLNGDILLPPDFVSQVAQVEWSEYLVVGQRLDLSRDALFDASAQDWRAEIRSCYRTGQIGVHDPGGIDYFCFPRGLWRGLGSLTIGRSNYDNALVAYCLRRRIPIIDATWSIQVVHQWHDYSHVKGKHEAFYGEEAMANARLHDVEHSPPDIEDAGWRLRSGRLERVRGFSNPLRRGEVALRYRAGLKLPSYGLRALSRAAWLLGCCRPRVLSIPTLLGAEQS